MQPIQGENIKLTGTKDLAVGLHTLLLLKPKWSGTVAVAIVYDPRSAQSSADGENIARLLDNGVGAPGIRPIPALVSVDDLATINRVSHAIDGAGTVIVVTLGVPREKMAEVEDTARQLGALSMSADLNCVRDGYCVLGVSSNPVVKIFYNDRVAKSNGIIFIDAFAMMVKGV